MTSKKKQTKEQPKKEIKSQTVELKTYMNWKIYIILALVILSISTYVRYNQYNYWTQHKTLYFTDGYPAMTTLDAYYWLRYAKEDKNGTYYKNDNDTLRAYPDSTTKRHPAPLLSFMISKLSKLSNLSIYKSGLFLIPLLASLFIIPAALYFYYSKMPMAGIVGGFVATFSWMYYIRTSMGRVDTDLLQLFFLFLSSLFLLLINDTKDKKKIYIYSSLIGLTLAFFVWWYGHNGIIIVYMSLLIVMLYINKISKKTIAISALLLGIFANPAYTFNGIAGFLGFAQNYFSIKSSSSLGFPNILNTITEAEHIADSKVLLYILSSKPIDFLGLIAFVISIKFLKTKIIPLLPVVGLGCLAFISSNRSIMFLSFFVGAGIGFVIDWSMSYIKNRYNFNATRLLLLSVTASGLIIFGLSNFSAIGFVPKPSIAPDIVDSFVNIKHRIKKANIVSWWDYGYSIEDIDGFATYQDGGAHGGARTYFIARGFSTDNQTQFYNTISYIDKFGIKSIDDAIKNKESVESVVDNVTTYNKPIEHKDNYLLFTRDMIAKFGAITYLGRWNFKQKKSYPLYFQMLGCNNFDNDMLICGNIVFDLKKGLINNKIPISKVVFSSNGHIKWQKHYSEKGNILELILRNNRLIYALLCNTDTYNTNFNQIYLLGNYNKKYFKEVYNNFPSARMFEILR